MPDTEGNAVRIAPTFILSDYIKHTKKIQILKFSGVPKGVWVR